MGYRSAVWGWEMGRMGFLGLLGMVRSFWGVGIVSQILFGPGRQFICDLWVLGAYFPRGHIY